MYAMITETPFAIAAGNVRQLVIGLGLYFRISLFGIINIQGVVMEIPGVRLVAL